MELKQYISSLPKTEREQFARRCGTSIKHIYNIMCGCKSCSAELAVAMEHESGGAVSVSELRPAFAKVLTEAGYIRASGPSTQAAA